MSAPPTTPDFLDPPVRAGEIGRLGPYRVISLLGEGGMGQVFRAEDTRLKRVVALKVMNRRFAATPHSRERFIEEARSMAAVHHDNVATLFEVGQQKTTPFMAMELLQGQSLEELLDEGRRYRFDEVIEIGKQAALGLDAAHQRGIVHRDIKPANLWMQSPQQRIKILDFGLALAGTGEDRLVTVGKVMGTLGYLAPEQAGNEPVDERTDLYALGVVLYELCSGNPPILEPSGPEQFIAILTRDPVPMADVNTNIPLPLSDLIGQLLSKNPGDRVPTALKLHQRFCEVAEEIAHGNQKQLEIDIGGGQLPEVKQRSLVERMPLAAQRVKAGIPEAEIVLDDDPEVAEVVSPMTMGVRAWALAAAGVILFSLLGAYFMTGPRRVAQRVPATDSSVLPSSAQGSSGSELLSGESSSAQSSTAQASSQSSVLSGGDGKFVREGVRNEDVERAGGSGPVAQPITGATLAALSVEPPAESKIKVAVGSVAQFTLTLLNQAESAQTDPKMIHRGVKKVAVVAIYLKQEGKSKQKAPAYPFVFSASQLPGAGTSKPVVVQFLTSGLEPGRYTVIFELQAPLGAELASVESELILTKSS
ncbi:Serine/threonine protein kinase [Neorhodopirellula lusitana]|uniref:Serine/threonine protein kinase n=2 Tax=Neorhodopirellula lusitana TaxID=445327 RepID=A0ABY1PWI3_9BACT|nr:Serine/threonine protein kinase [Neorhodopirellula lusitana]